MAKFDMSMMGKAMENSSVGKAVKGGAKSLMSMYGCSNEMNRPSDDELVYAKGDQACLVQGTNELEVVLLDDVKEGQNLVLALLPNGDKRMIDVPYLVDRMNCKDMEQQPDMEEEGEDD